MASNLFIAYDLDKPGQNYAGVRDRIRELGPHWQFQFSLFYVHTELTAQQAYIAGAMDSNDRLAVVLADAGVVTNWDHPPIDQINAIWQAA